MIGRPPNTIAFYHLLPTCSLLPTTTQLWFLALLGLDISEHDPERAQELLKAILKDNANEYKYAAETQHHEMPELVKYLYFDNRGTKQKKGTQGRYSVNTTLSTSSRSSRSQEEPGGVRRSQEEPGGARRSQEEPGGARRSQEVHECQSTTYHSIDCARLVL